MARGSNLKTIGAMKLSCKKSLKPEFFLVCSISIAGWNQALSGKNVLTSLDGSDNQNVKRVLLSIIPNSVPWLVVGGA